MTASFWWILVGMAVYGAQHSFFAANTMKDACRKWLGDTVVDRFYRLFFNLVGIITFLPILWMVAALPNAGWYTIPAPWVYAAYGVQIISLGLAGITVIQTGAADFLGLSQPLKADPNPPQLMTGGFYRWVRHPLYTFSILFLIAAPAMTWNWAALSLGSILYFYVGAIYEERKLERIFGAAYAEYKKRTPMLVPGMRLKR